MRSRDLSPTVASRPTRPDASGAWRALHSRRRPAMRQRPIRRPTTQPVARTRNQRPQNSTNGLLLTSSLVEPGLRAPVPGFASNATRVPSYSMRPKGSIAPAFSPRRSVGSGIGGRPARTLQANSPSVLRYRVKNLASRRRSRSSLCPSFGSADEGLGSKPGAGDSGRVAKGDFVQNEMRQQGQQPSTNNSSVRVMTARPPGVRRAASVAIANVSAAQKMTGLLEMDRRVVGRRLMPLLTHLILNEVALRTRPLSPAPGLLPKPSSAEPKEGHREDVDLLREAKFLSLYRNTEGLLACSVRAGLPPMPLPTLLRGLKAGAIDPLGPILYEGTRVALEAKPDTGGRASLTRPNCSSKGDRWYCSEAVGSLSLPPAGSSDA